MTEMYLGNIGLLKAQKQKLFVMFMHKHNVKKI